MREKALSYRITGIDFINYYDFIHIGTNKRNYCIDELENLLKFINSETECEGYTITIGNWSEL